LGRALIGVRHVAVAELEADAGVEVAEAAVAGHRPAARVEELGGLLAGVLGGVLVDVAGLAADVAEAARGEEAGVAVVREGIGRRVALGDARAAGLAVA